MLWDLGSGDYIGRHPELLKQAERDRLIRSVRTAQPHVPNRHLMAIRQRVGIALIRRGEALAGICANPAIRLS